MSLARIRRIRPAAGRLFLILPSSHSARRLGGQASPGASPAKPAHGTTLDGARRSTSGALLMPRGEYLGTANVRPTRPCSLWAPGNMCLKTFPLAESL
jgi:hypothetical protein